MKIRAADLKWLVFYTRNFSPFCVSNCQEIVHVERKDLGDQESMHVFVHAFIREMGEVKPFDSLIAYSR